MRFLRGRINQTTLTINVFKNKSFYLERINKCHLDFDRDQVSFYYFYPIIIFDLFSKNEIKEFLMLRL